MGTGKIDETTGEEIEEDEKDENSKDTGTDDNDDTSDDSGKQDDDNKSGTEDKGVKDNRLDVVLRENSELKKSSISQQEQIDFLTASAEKQNELLQEKGIITDEDIEKPDPNVEKMQKMQDSMEETRLSMALESAKAQEGFKDVTSVVTQSAFDLKVSELAQVYTDQHGGDLIENGQALLDQIWGMPNPYTYMYGLIKEEPSGDDSEGTPKKPVDAPGSLANTGGGADNLGSALSKQIDDMSELELSEALDSGKIKQADYDAYMKGELVAK